MLGYLLVGWLVVGGGGAGLLRIEGEEEGDGEKGGGGNKGEVDKISKVGKVR